MQKIRLLLVLCFSVLLGNVLSAGNTEMRSTNLPKISGESLIDRTNKSIHWYREVQSGNQWVSEPSDIYYWNTQHLLSNQILQTAFASITAELSFVEVVPISTSKTNLAASLESEHLGQLTADRAAKIDQLKQQIKTYDSEIRNENNSDTKTNLISRRSALQTQLIFLERLKAALQKTGGLLKVPGDALDSTTLAGQLEGLQQSIADELISNGSSANIETAKIRDLDSGGLFSRAEGLFSLARDIRGIDGLISATTQFQKELAKSEAPMRACLKTILQHGDDVSNAMQGQDLKNLTDAQRDSEKLAADFEKIWLALQPQQEALLLIERSKHNLQLWHDAILHHEAELARSLLIKIITLVSIIVIILLLSEFWRRVTFNYVNDDRRRRQFLFIRKLVVSILLGVIIITSFVSNLSSLAAFTGLLTVAIALALQTILLSIAAYFFIIGKHGLKVGDRITAAGALGEIVDIGLVRFYLKELSGTAPDLHPTGRIVTYPNSIIFQPVPLYKQMANTALIWHELIVNVRIDADIVFVKEKTLSLVNTAYEEYHKLLEIHTTQGDWILGLKVEAPSPYLLTRKKNKNNDVVVLFPVNLMHENQIDQVVIKAVQTAVAKDEAFKKAIDGTPYVGIHSEF